MTAFFSISTQLGGAEKSLLDFLSQYHKTHRPIIFIAAKNEGPLLEEIKKLGIAVEVFQMPDWLLSLSRRKPVLFLMNLPLLMLFIIPLVFNLNSLIKEKNIKKVHSTGLKFHLLLGFYSFLFSKIRLVIHLRDLVSSRLLKKVFIFLSQNKNIKFVVNSKATLDSLGVKKAILIYNGFEFDFSRIEQLRSQPHESLKLKWAIPRERKLILQVGAVARWKGQKEFIDAALILCQKRSNLQFLIIGSEIYDTASERGELHRLKAYVDQLKLNNSVQFIPFQKDLSPFFVMSSVLCHSAIEPEPFGRIIIEAMAHKVAVTASADGGPLEIISHEKNGLLHSPLSIEERARNIERLIDDTFLSEKITAQALSDVNLYSLSNHCEKLSNVFSEF